LELPRLRGASGDLRECNVGVTAFMAAWSAIGRHRAPAGVVPRTHPQGDVRQFRRETWLFHRVVLIRGDFVDHCCDAWSKSDVQPWRIISIEGRERPRGF